MHRRSVFILCFFLHVLCVRCESQVKCELGAFLENSDGTDATLIDSGLAVADKLPDSCNETDTCSKAVLRMAQEGTRGGNFTLTLDDREGYTIGDMLCDKAEAVFRDNVRHKYVRAYWRLCESEWTPTEFRMPESLCCDDGLYVPCEKLGKTEL